MAKKNINRRKQHIVEAKMNHSDHESHLFCTFLTGVTTPFSNIFDAVSEQILLLIFKARQLNENTEYHKWFAEQHLVLKELRALSGKINKIYPQNRLYYFEKLERDSLMDALIFMRPIYEGFDEGKVSLKTWGDMNSLSSERRGRTSNEIKLLGEFIQNDFFAILTKNPTHCLPIPSEERKGYCHQDLSIAHSCSSELLALLDDFYKIDSLQILADAILNLISYLHDAKVTTPDCLAKFKKIQTLPLIGERRKSRAFHEIIDLISNEGRVEFIERLAKQCPPIYANYLLYQFVGIYASEIVEWLAKLQMYFNYAESTPFEWKFTTVTPDSDGPSEEQQQTMAWDSDYCQISIKRDFLLKLIQANALHDAVDSLADCLLQIYYKPAQELRGEKGAIPVITDQERQVYQSNSYRFGNVNQGSYRKYIDILKTFLQWYEQNKVLLISQKKKRTEQVSVKVRLAGLRCYDLKVGIPDGKGLKIKDGVYDQVKKDASLGFENSISDVSLQRYHSQVKKIIQKDIDALLKSQRDSNSRYPFSGDYRALKPLWSKSMYHDEG